ncbi:hypothetical protein N0V90_012861 [Kalmusia sp. IMI 367209]|nr:hypothetical protein N0V90_012861 [Kalmusia sp. IMI 367209]
MTTPDNTLSRKRSFSHTTDTSSEAQDSTEFQYPPSFYDKLSRVWLTELALREHNRRLENTGRLQTTPPPPDVQESSEGKVTNIDQAALQRFARHGGPDLTAIRDYSFDTMPLRPHPRGQNGAGVGAGNQEADSSTAKKKSFGPYDSNFEQALADNGARQPDYGYFGNIEPAAAVDLDELSHHVLKDRDDKDLAELNQGKLNRIKQVFQQGSKGDVSDFIFSILEGELDYGCRVSRVPFKKLKPLFPGVQLAVPIPDVSFGARPDQIHPTIGKELSRSIKPFADRGRAIVPNCFVEVKGNTGAAHVLELQALYDGTIGARAVFDLEKFAARKPVFDAKIKAISMTIMKGILSLYATHILPPTHPEHPPVRYETTLVDRFILDTNVSACRRAVIAYRNALDWTKTIRNEAIEKANQRQAAAVSFPEAFTTGCVHVDHGSRWTA